MNRKIAEMIDQEGDIALAGWALAHRVGVLIQPRWGKPHPTDCLPRGD
ncbi:MAG: hypothetical protein ACYSUD_23450 [Planctomycetota bacterium]